MRAVLCLYVRRGAEPSCWRTPTKGRTPLKDTTAIDTTVPGTLLPGGFVVRVDSAGPHGSDGRRQA
jgi:hypothetical protein